MDPLVPVMGQMAVESVRRQFEYEPEGEVSPTRPARITRVTGRIKRLVATRRGAGGGPVPATERR
jgi:hypothetical protein